MHQGDVLLERRPSSGIWGGLWVFPELGSGSPAGYAKSAFGCELINSRRMAEIDHGFTHFRLKIRPVFASVAGILPHAEAPGRIWLNLEEAARAAVPAPVRALLSSLRRDQAL